MLIGGWSDVALCSDLAALAYNRFERCALLRCGIVFYAINAPTLNFGTCRSHSLTLAAAQWSWRPRHRIGQLGLRLASVKPCERLLSLMRGQLARPPEPDAALLCALPTLPGPGPDQLTQRPLGEHCRGWSRTSRNSERHFGLVGT
jgi:hypothetical protein